MIPEKTWEFVVARLMELKNRADEMGKLIEFTKIPIQSPLFGPFVDAEISLINTLAFLVDDHYNIISKYVFDENFSKSYEDLKNAIENSYTKETKS